MRLNRGKFILATVALAGVVSGTLFLPPSTSTTLAADSSPSAKEKTAAELTAEIEKLKTLLPDQAHAMADVGYHMSHAWFAGEAKNWPLAKFYINETSSHIGWAVRIKPVRKGPGNLDFELQPYADAITKGPLNDLKTSIDQQDVPKFREAYQATLTTCYACHVASDKPYLRLRVPLSPDSGIIDFQPAAN